jgi:hypothetical protein
MTQQQQQQPKEVEEEEGGETMEEYALRQIRDLNAATRDNPRDVGLWLRYAAFQDEASQLLGRGWGWKFCCVVAMREVWRAKGESLLAESCQNNNKLPKLAPPIATA